MVDQCQHCTLKGDFDKCIATPCFNHDNWWAKEIQERLRLAEMKANQLDTACMLIAESNGDYTLQLVDQYLREVGYWPADTEEEEE